jgi:hypothetical protein
MRTIMKMLCGLAITAAAIPGAAIDASAAGKLAPAAHAITSRPTVGAAATNGADAPGYWGRGSYGRSWCYWHP